MNRESAKEALKGLEPQGPEKPLKVVLDEELEARLKFLFGLYCDTDVWKFAFHTFAKTQDLSLDQHVYAIALKNISKTPITPQVIEAFVERMPPDNGDYFGKDGLFVSALIQTSFNQGYNKFNADIRHFGNEMQNLGKFLKGKRDKQLELTITGDPGARAAQFTYYVNIKIIGNPGYAYGNASTSSQHRIMGNVGESCGVASKFSAFRIDGNADRGLASSAGNCLFVVRGEGKFSSTPRNCIIKLTDERTLRLASDFAKDSNSFYRIMPDGKEVIWWHT